MKGAFVATVGLCAIALSVTGLLLDVVRPGPLDVELTPVQVLVEASGSYLATAANLGPAGLCVVEPCTPRTRIDLQLEGLYAATYEARLEGPDSVVELGTLAPAGSAHRLAVDRAEDHTDKTRLVLLHAGFPLHAWPVGPGERSLTGPLLASFNFAPVRVHLDEIGAVSVSTTATSTLDLPPPSQATFVARLESGSTSVALGNYEPQGEVLRLDGRVERVRLQDQQRVTVYLVGPGAPATGGVPVWSSAL